MWANLDSIEDSGDNAEIIDGVIDTAILDADDRIDCALREGQYTVPFSDPPRLIVRCSALLAGVYLYEARGVQEYAVNLESNGAGNRARHKLERQKDEVEKLLVKIKSHQLSLGGGQVEATFPQIIPDA